MNINDALAGLTFGLELDDDEMITDAVVLARITRMSDGRSSFTIVGNDSIDEVVATGLLECGRQVTAAGWNAIEDDDL